MSLQNTDEMVLVLGGVNTGVIRRNGLKGL